MWRRASKQFNVYDKVVEEGEMEESGDKEGDSERARKRRVDVKMGREGR